MASPIGFIISLVILIIICSLIWWGTPIVLPDTITVKNKQRIAILLCILFILIWFSGGYGWGWSDAPWAWGHSPPRGRRGC